jgi:hypothetical protein
MAWRGSTLVMLQLLFYLLLHHGESMVLEAWPNVMVVLLWLRKLNLLPQELVEMEDFRWVTPPCGGARYPLS